MAAPTSIDIWDKNMIFPKYLEANRAIYRDNEQCHDLIGGAHKDINTVSNVVAPLFCRNRTLNLWISCHCRNRPAETYQI